MAMDNQNGESFERMMNRVGQDSFYKFKYLLQM